RDHGLPQLPRERASGPGAPVAGASLRRVLSANMARRDRAAESIDPARQSTVYPDERPTLPAAAGAEAVSSEPRATPSDAERPFPAGDGVAGRYTLLAPVGAGAQGEVWTASDRLLGEVVAIKWLAAGHRDASAGARREIAILRMLKIPG